MSSPAVTGTTIGIVGGGPSGLMLSHLLSVTGIDSVVVDNRTRLDIEQTVRAGILERDSVRLLVESGVSDRVLREGHERQGIDLGFAGAGHRIDFQDLTGSSVWLYPQTNVFRHRRRHRDATRAGLAAGAGPPRAHQGRAVAVPRRDVLHTADAIHIVAAIELGATTFLTYDRRQAQAAEASGLAVIAPRRAAGWHR